MSRRRAGISPSLFPFLAVLVCTLGTLILLLALVATESRDTVKRQVEQELAASGKSGAPKPANAPENSSTIQADGAPKLTAAAAKMLLDQETFRLEHFISARDQQVAAMERKRDELTHVEEHKRKLKDELTRLNKEVETATAKGSIAQVDQQTLVMMRSEIEKLEGEIQQIRESATGGKPRVVLVPHKGPNGTDRRPVYVECTATGVTIWPEGSRITLPQLIAASRAERPSGNALDAALRTVRSHAMKEYGDSIPPYPLIVVRPDGIDSYRFARAAMEDWDDQYGYELVPADVELAFPTPDKNLKRNLDLSIHEAVQRGGVASNYVTGGSKSGRGGAGGKLEEIEEQLASNGQSIQSGDGQSSEGQFEAGGVDGQPSEPGFAGSAPGGTGPQPSRPLPTLSARDLDQQARANGFRSLRDQMPGRPSSVYGEATPGSMQTSYGAAPTLNPDSPSPSLNKLLSGDDSMSSAGPSEPTFEPFNGAAGSTGQNSANNTTNLSNNGGDGSQSMGSPSNQSKSAAMQPQATPTSGAPQTPTGSPPAGSPPSGVPPLGDVEGEPPPMDSNQELPTTPPSPMVQSMVKRGGQNWALPSSMQGMHGTEVVRPISMVCYDDRYELLEQGQVVGTYPFDANGTHDATIQLATAVRDRVETWGTTLPGGRWQPRLEVLVAPHADRRFHELRTLMNGSGVEVIQRVK